MCSIVPSQLPQSVYEFLRLDPRGKNGSSLLHLACARDTSAVGRYPICQFPSLDAIRLLVECGADPNSRDDEFSTCLHVAAANRPAKPPVVQGCDAEMSFSGSRGKLYFRILLFIARC